MSVLSDFRRGPFELGQRGDQAGDDAGFANATRMSADND
jgi:hypothetical protein